MRLLGFSTKENQAQGLGKTVSYRPCGAAKAIV